MPFPSPGDLPDSGIEPGSPALQADSLQSEPPGKPSKAIYVIMKIIKFTMIMVSRFIVIYYFVPTIMLYTFYTYLI